ncbi:MAG: hypothetical protein V4510_06720 [bacterium]
MTVHHAVLRIDCKSPSDAARMLRALAADNGVFLHAVVDGGWLVLTATASTALGLLRTFDDTFASLRGAGLS